MKPKDDVINKKLKEGNLTRQKYWFKQKIELDELEAQFGLILKERNDHKNYVMLNFSDLEDVVKYFEIFKKVFRE